MSSFRLIDLITSLGIAVLLLGVTIAARHKAQEEGTIAACAQNLQRIGAAISQYQMSSGGEFPRTRYEPDAPITAYTGADSPDPFSPLGPAINDVTAAAFLLAREVNVPAKVFACPAALRHGLSEVDTFTDQSVDQRSNFSARVHYNYSLANMYPSKAAVATGYSLDRDAASHDASFAIAGDTNPGPEGGRTATTQTTRKDIRMANSPNHQRDGQNVLFADGRVEFMPSPFVQKTFDNVYLSVNFPNPDSATDIVLLPVWSEGPSVTPDAVWMRRWVFGVALVVTIFGFAFVLYHGRRKTN